MSVRLSVNINKVALIRNARGANYPDILAFARKCEEYGAQGITVHPRPDERHIRFADLEMLKEVVSTEFNIEGYPSDYFVKEVCRVKPHQVTLVPDAPGALTSNAGWDTVKHKKALTDVIGQFQSAGIRVSLFMEPHDRGLLEAKEAGADRVEFYTGGFANLYHGPEGAEELNRHVHAARTATDLGLGINAGHDLNLDNLNDYCSHVKGLKEVSIGHALIVDSLEYGLRNTILMYLSKIQN